jgi:hypothetical protein
LRDALGDLGRAVEIFDKTDQRLSFAELLHVTGGVECELGAMTHDERLCRRGLKNQRTALGIFEDLQLDGHIQLALNNLAQSLQEMAPFGDGTTELEEAEAHLRRAVKVRSEAATDDPALRARRNLLSHASAKRGHLRHPPPH